MNIYEFINPSDPITMKAHNDKVAYMCTIGLSNGKAGLKRINLDQSETPINAMLMFSKTPEQDMKDFLEMDPKQFLQENKKAIAECFASFQYTTPHERLGYDRMMEQLPDDEARAAVRLQTAEQKQTSASGWVKSAWRIGEMYAK